VNTLIDCGCDAISCTANEGTEAHAVMLSLYEQHFPAERKRGMDVRDIAPSGYRGNQCGSVFLGVRAGHALAQFRGQIAKEAAERLARVAIRPHVTRLDWQATFRPPCTDREASHRYRRFIDAAVAGNQQKQAGRGVVYTARDLANSYNLVSGGRQSYWRTYNKHAESPDAYPPGTWRHEWQIGGKRAARSWGHMCDSRNQADTALGTLRGYLLRFGLDEPCLREAPPLVVTHGKHKSDTERRLAWLESSVGPVISKLLADGITMQDCITRMMPGQGVHGYWIESTTLDRKPSEIKRVLRQRG